MQVYMHLVHNYANSGLAVCKSRGNLDYMNTINEFIKALRLDKGLSQAELADMLNISQSTLSRWERGLNRLTEEQIHLLAVAFEIDPRSIYAFLASTDDSEVASFFRIELKTLKAYQRFMQFVSEQDPKTIVIHQLSKDKQWK